MEIRKQVYELTKQYLLDYPIWEFCSDEEGDEGQDEATVKPSADPEVPGYSPGAYIVAADCSLSDGTSLPGYIYSGKPGDFGCLQPNVICKGGQVNFWLGSSQFARLDRLADCYALLEKPAQKVFPVSVTTKGKIAGNLMSMTILGFMLRETDGSVTSVSG